MLAAQQFQHRLDVQRGRPIGTGMLLLALERIGYPVTVVALALVGAWGALALMVGAEVALTLAITLWLAGSGHRGAALLQGLAATPLRYALILLDPPAMLWFAGRLWLARKHRWYVQRENDGDRRAAARALRR